MRKWMRWLAVMGAVGVIGTGLAAAGSGGNQWTSAGQNLQNTRYQSAESKIGVGNVANLGVKWAFATGGDVSATPAVDGKSVYVPDWAGNLFAVDRKTGRQVWQATISDATGVPGDKARATPVISGDKVILGTQGNPTGSPGGPGGRMLAYDRHTGELLWSTVLDSHPAAIVTQSAVVHGGLVYVGVSSQEELFALAPGYVCCDFRGSVVALDVDTGAIVWQTRTVPDGYSGGPVWGSTPAVDTRRGQLYITTGNNYSVPQSAQDCVAAAGDDTDAVRACIAPDDHFDSIMALDLKTGAVRWSTAALPYDAWTFDCFPPLGDGTECPEPAGPDLDFGQGAALFTVKPAGKGKPRDLVGAGQKSGQYWALDPDTGAVQWVTQAGPSGSIGGLQWGSAVDGKRVYTANANSDGKPWPGPSGATTGVWSGLDAATGEVLWETRPPHGGSTSGPVSAANGVVYGCTTNPADAEGHMYALNAATGVVLWHFASDGSCLSGAAVSNGTVFWGSGYAKWDLGTPGNMLYAFELS